MFNCENQTFDLINTIQTIVKNNENILNAKNLTVEYDTEDFNKKAIHNDENAVKIILQNIIETSIKLTDVGTIFIKVTHPDMDVVKKSGAKIGKASSSLSYVQISISDTGMGLAEAELDGIFEPYTQLDKTHKKPIVRSITLGTAYTMLKRMGGAVWINSEVMKGSTFNIILPIEKAN